MLCSLKFNLKYTAGSAGSNLINLMLHDWVLIN